jgi:hypothetical protein
MTIPRDLSNLAPGANASGVLQPTKGGTGATTLTANNVILGNGTGAVQFVAPSTNGNVLTSNGTTWTSAAPAATLSGQTNSATPFETSLGYQAGNVSTGTSNTFIGYQAGLLTSTGSGNTALGALALNQNTTGSTNIGLGQNALRYNQTGGGNIGIGQDCLSNVSGTGISFNVAIGQSAGSDLTSGSQNIIIGFGAQPSSATVSNEVTIGSTDITSTRLRGMVELNAAMFEKATISATAATGTVNYDARSQSVLYYTSNASGNWTLNIRAASGVSLDSVMTAGESMTVAFLVTNGGTAYYQTGFQVDSVSVTPKWQGGTAPPAGNANSIDVYVITVIKTGAATFTALASQTKFA